MPRTTFAVVSDLHCRLKTDPEDSYLVVGAARVPVNRHPVEALLDLIAREHFQVDALLVPGDLANRASDAGLADGWNHAMEIGHSMNARMVIPVIGNHDVDSRNPDPAQIFHHVRHLRPDFPFPTLADNQSYFADGFCLLELPDTQIIALNSVIGHLDEASAKRGTLSNVQIQQMEQALQGRMTAPLRVALMHHHPILHTGPYLTDADVMMNGDVLMQALRRLGVRLVVHGHKHLVRLDYNNNVAVFSSGSLAAKLNTSFPTAMRNTFHLIEVEGDSPAGVRGRIMTWNYFYNLGWHRSKEPYTDFPYQTGFGRTSGIPDIAAHLIALSHSQPNESRFDEAAVLRASSDIPFLTPPELSDLSALLQPHELYLSDEHKGRMELWKEFRP